MGIVGVETAQCASRCICPDTPSLIPSREVVLMRLTFSSTHPTQPQSCLPFPCTAAPRTTLTSHQVHPPRHKHLPPRHRPQPPPNRHRHRRKKMDRHRPHGPHILFSAPIHRRLPPDPLAPRPHRRRRRPRTTPPKPPPRIISPGIQKPTDIQPRRPDRPITHLQHRRRPTLLCPRRGV
jgi:hypothetical protein